MTGSPGSNGNAGAPFTAPIHPAAALQSALAERGLAYSRIVGESMRPSLHAGDLVLLKPCETVRPGDIVTFALGERLVTHRVLSTHASTITCRGDGRRAADPPVSPEAVIAKVSGVVGRRTPDWRIDFWRVRMRWLGVDWRPRLAKLRDQADLLWCSLTFAQSRRPDPEAFTTMGESIAYPEGRVLRLREAVEPLDLRGESPLVALIVPALVYGSLSSERRGALIRAMRGRHVFVYGLPLASAGRIVRFSAGLHRSLASLGFVAGEPGDVARRAAGGLLVVHAFTAGELERELERFGLGPVTVEALVTEAGPRLRAVAGRPINESSP